MVHITVPVTCLCPAVHRPGEAEAAADANMGTQGTGRKRAPLKDRFSAEDEALSSIAREVSLL